MDQGPEHVGAGRQEHHGLALLDLLHRVGNDGDLRALVAVAREPVERAVLRPGQVFLRLAPGDAPDHFFRKPVYRARHPVRLLEDDLVIVRDIGIEERLGRRACKGIDGLVVVAGHDEVIGALAPLADQGQLHPVEVLRLVREDDGWSMGRHCNVAEARLNQVGEVEQPVFPLILPPLFIEADQRLRPGLAGQYESAVPA